MITQRIHVPGGLYHITQRGNARKKIFFSNEDRSFFCLLMQKYFTKYNHRLHAFCLMDNHIHLLIQAGALPFAKAMQSITSIYAKRLNKRCNATGHQFQSRYFSSIIECDYHLLTVLKYIHMNPVRAKMVKSPGEHDWNTHNYYSYNDNISWIERCFCLSMFDKDTQKAVAKYNQFMKVELNKKEIKKIKRPANGCIIGSDDFVSLIEAQAGQVNIIKRVDVESVLQATCTYFYYTQLR